MVHTFTSSHITAHETFNVLKMKNKEVKNKEKS